MSNEMTLPWDVFPVSREDASVITSAGVFLIPTVHPELAAQIVRVVNSHDALVEALEGMLEAMQAKPPIPEYQDQMRERARAALTAAQGDGK